MMESVPVIAIPVAAPIPQSSKADPAPPTSVRKVVRVPVMLQDGRTVDSLFVSFHGLHDGREHFAIKFGSPSGPAPLVRLHSECMTGDVFGSARCDCGPQLREAMQRLQKQSGYLLYLRQEGRGIGLFNKLDAYSLQEWGYDTYAANRSLGRRDDERDYSVAADMLRAMGVERITLLSNNPDKRNQLETAGITVEAQVPTGAFPGPHNMPYLQAKVDHTHHTIDLRHSSFSSLVPAA